jgi:NAD(P)-dependent dehydrogenase (short-subunit alcohol dehydrogenase family)
MDLELDGKLAVVTAASRGIGLAVVRALAAEGARVVAGARRPSHELDQLVEEGRVRWVAGDLVDPDGPAALIAAAGGPVDILVNNLGGAPVRTGGFLSVTDEQWHATLELNLMGAIRTTRAVLPGMLERGRGSIVNICSVNSSLPDPLVIDYSTAKAALAAFSKALSKEVGGKGVRINTVSPGPVETDLWLGAGGVAETVGKASGSEPGDVAKGAAGDSVTGRFTHPEEVADAVLMLAGARSGNTTGADIRIDGGLIPTW